MPGGGPAAAAAITEQPPDTVAIMLSAYCADDDLSASLRSRAVEYLLRDTGPEATARGRARRDRQRGTVGRRADRSPNPVAARPA